MGLVVDVHLVEQKVGFEFAQVVLPLAQDLLVRVVLRVVCFIDPPDGALCSCGLCLDELPDRHVREPERSAEDGEVHKDEEREKDNDDNGLEEEHVFCFRGRLAERRENGEGEEREEFEPVGLDLEEREVVHVDAD